MQFIRPFSEFDPFAEELPKKVPPIIDYYFSIAKTFIENRNRDEIEFAIATINYLLDGGREYFGGSTENNETQATDDFDIDDFPHQKDEFTPSAILFEIYKSEEIDIADQEDFPNANWGDYFAILALVEIGEMVNEFSIDMHSVEIASRSGEIGESIGIASILRDVSIPKSKTASMALSANNQSAAIQRHREITRVKNDFIEFYKSETARKGKSGTVNYSALARKFYRIRIELEIARQPSGPLARQSMDNALRMLLDALREYRKRKPST